MWRRLSLCVVLLCCICMAHGQVHLTPVADGEVAGFGSASKTQLENKLRSVLSSRKLLSKAGDSRFVLAAHLTVLEKEVLGTAPTKIAIRLQVNVAAGDGMTGTCYASNELTVKGVGQTEQAALTSAIRSISPSDKRVGMMLDEAVQRIIGYYNEQGSSIISNAVMLAGQEKYEQAIYELSLIPMECTAYEAAQEAVQQVYVQYINREAGKALGKAKAQWAGNPTAENAETVMAMLMEIDPSADNYAEVEAFMSDVEKHVTKENAQKRADALAREKAERDLERERMQIGLEREKAQMAAIESIAYAYAESLPNVVYYVDWW